jgi:anthranilate synthase component 1
MIRPALEEAKRLSRGCNAIPIALEIFSDQKTPIEVLKNIKRESDNWFILESVNGSDNWGRYTFLGYKPVFSIYGSGDAIVFKDDDGAREIGKTAEAVDVIRDMISKYASPHISYLPPFTGGFVGYFAYDFVQHFIPGLKLNSADSENYHDFHLMLTEKVIAFDHFKQKIFIIVNIPVENLENNYIKGVTELKDIERMILAPAVHTVEETPRCGEFTASFTEDGFKVMVEKVKCHIDAGDIMQAVVSNRFKAGFKGSLMNAYRLLRTINPSPYMVYMRLDDMEIACASPETLVALRNGDISSFPLAGTCPSSASDEENAALVEALLHDEKELAEHDMLVDLARSDIGKVSRFGSVKVGGYRQIKRFSHVSHISSHVTGQLREGMDALDVIAAALPAGTLSGAPKKRACEIIDEAENNKRGVYGGAIGYIDFTGNMDMCIGIRMAVLKDGSVCVQAGAGIVADSVPEKEYRETRNKARAVMESLKNCGEV